MIKKTALSSKTLHKNKLRDLRMKKLEEKMRNNIKKRKKNIENIKKVKNG